MINLLPHEARKLLIKEYWLRVTTLWAFLGTAALVGISALFLPSYLLIESEKRAFEAAHVISSETRETIADIEAEVTAANGLATELKGRMTRGTITESVRAVFEAVPSGVVVSSYVTSRTALGIESIRVQGVATSREALIAFQQALEAQEAFTDAEVPIDDFVKGSDLSFEIHISVADNFR